MTKTSPTKANLQSAKRGRDLARQGFALMDKKRLILARELLSRTERVTELQSQVNSLFGEAYSALQTAQIALGACDAQAETAPEDRSLSLRYQSVMGLELPMVTGGQNRPDHPPYGFTGGDGALDEALWLFSQAKALIPELAQAEISLCRLTQALQKTRKRAKALERLVIPRLDATIREMETILEEAEKGTFVRQKWIKNQKSANL